MGVQRYTRLEYFINVYTSLVFVRIYVYNNSMKITGEQLNRMAKAGETLSRQCSDIWTGELIRTSLPWKKYLGIENDLDLLISATERKLVDYGRIDDTIYLGADNQYKWTLADWKKAIQKICEII